MARLGHPIFELIVDSLNVRSGDTIVDLGCGTGSALHALQRRERNLHLVGFDASRAAVDTTRSSIAGVRAAVADLNSPLPLEDGSVDGVLCHNVLECLDDPVFVMNEAARVLRPGGRAVWSHTDFDGIIVSGPDATLTRTVLHAYADTPPPWTSTADGQTGRKLPGLVRRSRLRMVEAVVHVTTSTYLDGDARARIDEIAAALRAGVGSLSAAHVVEWRREVDEAQVQGEFFFSEPAVVVTAESI
jgi:SAM-dependent methyltransferase